MVDKNYLITVENVENILVTFGITKATKNYDRWVNEQGCLLKDFKDVLYDSRFVFILDWREEIEYAMETIINALNELNVDITACRVEGNENKQKISCGNNSCVVEYNPNDSNSTWNKVIRGISSIIPKHIIFKEDPLNGGSDTEVYAVLTEDDWKYLYNLEPDVMNYLFKDLKNRPDNWFGWLLGKPVRNTK